MRTLGLRLVKAACVPLFEGINPFVIRLEVKVFYDMFSSEAFMVELCVKILAMFLPMTFLLGLSRPRDWPCWLFALASCGRI